MNVQHQLHHERELFDLNISILYQGENDPITISTLHWHEFIEIIICVESGHIFTVDDNAIELNPGEILVIGPNVIHSSFRPSQFIGKQYVFRFHPNIFSTLPTTPTARKFMDMFLSYASPYSNHIINNNDLYKDCVDIAKKLLELKKASEENVLLANSYFLMLIHSFIKIKELFEDKYPTGKKYTETVAAIKRTAIYIQTHYSEKITLEDMAKSANVSYSYYSQLFKEIMGKSFSDFLISVRLAVADSMLLSNAYSMSEIAEKVGLTPQSSFNHTYKKFRGLSPKQYKEKIKKSV